jgi:hypothetical protein
MTVSEMTVSAPIKRALRLGASGAVAMIQQEHQAQSKIC